MWNKDECYYILEHTTDIKPKPKCVSILPRADVSTKVDGKQGEGGLTFGVTPILLVQRSNRRFPWQRLWRSSVVFLGNELVGRKADCINKWTLYLRNLWSKLNRSSRLPQCLCVLLVLVGNKLIQRILTREKNVYLTTFASCSRTLWNYVWYFELSRVTLTKVCGVQW